MKKFMIVLAMVLTLACSIAVADAVEAKIGDAEYATLQSAIDAASTGDEIVLQDDVSATDLRVVSRNITIDGAGKTITLESPALVDGGTEIVIKDATIEGTASLTAGDQSMVSLVNVTMNVPVSLDEADLNTVGGTLAAAVSADHDSYVTFKGTAVGGPGVCAVTLTDSTLEASKATFSLSDGFVKADHSKVLLSESSFAGSTSTAVEAQNDSRLTINGCSFTNNTGINGGALYLKESTAALDESSVLENKANIGGGIYVDTDAGLTVENGEVRNNTADTAAADVFIASDAAAVSLPAVSSWKVDAAPRFKLDGWYEDLDTDRWSLTKAYNGSGNTYAGDSVDVVGHSLRAGFTAYDEIRLEKTWVDHNNMFNTRPKTVDVELRDSASGTVSLLALEGTGADAIVELSAGSEWKGTITPLAVKAYDTGHALAETSGNAPITTYQLNQSAWSFTPDAWTDESGATRSGPSGIYTVSLENVYIVPVNVAKVWDDVDNKDDIRPVALNTQLTLGGTVLNPYTDISLTEQKNIITLTPADDWEKTVYLLTDDSVQYGDIAATEGEITGYTNLMKSVVQNPDGSVSVVFVNHHELSVDASDTVSNANMVYIHYRADKEWDWNGTKFGALPHPEISVILSGDGQEVDRGVIPADERRTRYTFFNLPKYRDNEGSQLIDYIIREDITDSEWVLIQEREGTEMVDYWYSLDGMGRYRAAYTQAQIDADTAPLSTVQGTILNKYELLQDQTSISVKKNWKDHDNENGVRPASITFGLFEPDGNTFTGKYVTLTATDAWEGSIDGLDLYDAAGKEIKYNQYVLKESRDFDPTAPDSATWAESGSTLYIDGDHDYDYSVVIR